MRGLFAVCGIVLAAAPGAAAEVTFNKDVAPILFKQCSSCHRPGEIGPFQLLTYKDARKRADFIKEVTADRRMPPWKAEAGFGHFSDERRLTDEQIKTLAAWAEGGAVEGDPKDLPPAPRFVTGWQLGEPDLILEMPEYYTIPAAGRDIYRNFVIPMGVKEDRTVAAVEFRPGNRKVVHHALMFLDNTGAARKKDEADPGPGYSTFGGIGILPSGSLGGWAPGATARHLPDGVGMYLKKNSDLVLQIHYHPTGKEEVDLSTVGVYFTKKPAEHRLIGIPLVNRQINIAPGDAAYRRTAEFTIPVETQVIGVFPHMHLLGREMKVTAIKPDGEKEPLVWIKDWDFNWQGQYRLAKPLTLPKGTKLELEAVYDNSATNPRNPNNPPQAVHWGEQTTDEMCLCGVQVITTKQSEAKDLYLSVLKSRGGKLGLIFGGSPPEKE
jgi:hypothetical protein